jgi:hypothetical protein
VDHPLVSHTMSRVLQSTHNLHRNHEKSSRVAYTVLIFCRPLSAPGSFELQISIARKALEVFFFLPRPPPAGEEKAFHRSIIQFIYFHNSSSCSASFHCNASGCLQGKSSNLSRDKSLFTPSQKSSKLGDRLIARCPNPK